MFLFLAILSTFLFLVGFVTLIKPFWIIRSRKQAALITCGGLLFFIFSVIGGAISEGTSEGTEADTGADKPKPSIEQHVKNVVHKVFGDKKNGKDTAQKVEYSKDKGEVEVQIYYGKLVSIDSNQKITLNSDIADTMQGIFNRKEVDKVLLQVFVASQDKYGDEDKLSIIGANLDRTEAEKINWENISLNNFDELAINWWHPEFRNISY
ncbi:hypothetical protein [Paludifilum halophilum]|uniref:Uncharacterized protein n=1 Tax=Paludifilum halophilum TaxID=1642702 RepID=A0A235B209_9BACL|nr:hypothetical protein [Paludifilum halophilum]OYD06261.1 hypothetical protein CHM34_16990 [Paludifilum halophilum]